MARQGKKLVFFDIETFKYNLNVKEVSNIKVAEYSVSCIYEEKGKSVEKIFNTLTDMLNYFFELGFKNYEFLAHNGEGFDFWFLRKALIYDFGLIPKNKYSPNSTNHIYETRKKDIPKGKNYLLESHIKAKSKVNFEACVNGVKIKTVDTYPKFMLSVKGLGKKLETIGVNQHKQAYKQENYTQFDQQNNMSYPQLKKYQRKVFNKLSDEDKSYVMNDTRVIYQAYKHYNELFKGYDWKKRTLSMNIAEQYEVNDWAKYQLLHKLPKRMVEDYGLQKSRRLQFSDYFFKNEGNKKLSIYDWIRFFYNGGLNVYNDNLIGKIIDLQGKGKHIDLNSSYPTVMHNEKFPVELVDFSTNNTLLDINNRYQYLLEVSKKWLDGFLSDIKSEMIKKMFVKYLSRPFTNSVFITDVHLKLMNSFKSVPLKRLRVPVNSFMKWKGKRFAGKKVIDFNYKQKTKYKELKKEASEEDKKAYELIIANSKVLLNGIYGIPALRAYFPNFQLHNGEWINVKDDEGHLGFRNSERDIIFSVFTTAYAFRNLLKPLTYDVKDVDKGFIYADTDSIFMYNWYWEKIKDNVELDPVKLGAWDLEHKNIKKMYILNHKKYALEANGKIEVHAGGVRLSDLHADKYKKLEVFVDNEFHKGKKVDTQRSILTKEQTIAIYNGIVELDNGTKYGSKFYPWKNQEEYNKYMLKFSIFWHTVKEEFEKNGSEDAIYIESPFGTFSISDFFNSSFKNQDEINEDMRSFAYDQDLILKYLRGKK